ncbi:MAG TPA: hypothetical protein P5260_17265 [Candidatus Competibacter sp.]|nr:hypothetical protein [Candidatus Competibacter sp.]
MRTDEVVLHQMHVQGSHGGHLAGSPVRTDEVVLHQMHVQGLWPSK